jgi:ribonuclease HII
MKYAFADMAAKIASGSVPRGGFLGGARSVRCRVVVDGLFCPDLGGGEGVAECGATAASCEARVKADASCPEVMAASILAKCARDRLMAEYSALYPAYGYERHKGYPTKAHREACKQLGPSPIQRLTFTVR